jgi:multidrug efflux pump subunit AcrA (membrane-fusion protein)
VQPGNEILRLGDLSRVKVVIQVSELDLGSLRTGQLVKVRLDALPNRELTGTISRISPAANSASRQVPVEIVLPNPGGQIGSGLLTRVSLTPRQQARIIVPQTAIQQDRGNQGGGASQARSPQPNQSPNATRATTGNRPRSTQGTLFIVAEQDDKSIVEARSVTLGEQLDGNVEILSGLRPGERYVARSGRPLKDGESVRLSILSEQS